MADDLYKQDEEYTDVVFRVWDDARNLIGDGVIALFPNDKWDEYGLISSYEHVGQHGGAHYEGVISKSRPATEEEYASLKRELETPPYTYKLRVIKRRPHR